MTRNHWPLASPERLSPARPGSGFVASSYTGPWAGNVLSSILSLVQGRITSFWQFEACESCE